MKKENVITKMFVFGVVMFCTTQIYGQTVYKSQSKVAKKNAAFVSKNDVKTTRAEVYPNLNDFAKTSNSVEEYAKAKQEWIKNNPEAYKKMLENKTIQVISREELEKLPAERANYIKNHPDLYEIK